MTRNARMLVELRCECCGRVVRLWYLVPRACSAACRMHLLRRGVRADGVYRLLAPRRRVRCPSRD